MDSTVAIRSEDVRWSAVLERQAGDFLYAVTTMGVFCRPGCPSPRPLRRNVRFFDSVPEAEAAGFRACKRCDPKGERAALARAVVEDACAFIEAEEAIPSLERAGRAQRLLALPLPAHVPRPHRGHAALATPRGCAPAGCRRRWRAAPGWSMR